MGDGPVPAGLGVVAGQVAEIIVTLDGEPGRRGSGYRVGPRSVLTAAHVIEGAAAVRVRFDADLPGEWTAEAIPCWADPRSDFAVLTIVPREGEPAVAAARFGRIGSDRAAVLAAQAVGFPRFKLKTDDDAAQLQYRDSHQADGSVAVLSNRREGTLELTVPPPERDPARGVSPWEGMSGAALWIGDRVVGVIAKHHRSDGLSRLAAARLDLALADLDQRRRAELRTLLGLSDVLPDVVPPSTGEWVRTAYQAQVRDIAPDRLLDRDAELDELVGFCAGDQPYAWWQAGPWAGKSALMSWFVLHPPAGVDVVSFFITARLAGQSDSDACTTALIEQLAALLGESPATLLTAGARRGTLLRLLEDAANRSRETGRRLLLVIDGLDEDSGTATGPSIAALLPRRPPPEVRVLVASRPHPPIPDDVTDDHPLRAITPRRLDVSEHARDIERRAKHELKQLLAGDRLQRDVLGLITAAGGGLTLGDLEQLTERPPFEIEYLLGGVFGRSIGSRTWSPVVGRAEERVYLFTHETLRLVAERQYGNSLATYCDRLHAWGDTWRQREWPTDTPQYLLRSYPRMLASNNDIAWLVACATDQARHDRMRDLTGGDALAFTEISTAQQLIIAQPDPDLTSLALLAVQREHLTDRNSNIPTKLPAVWARIGQPARAEALANSIPHINRVYVLARVAMEVAAIGDHDRAARLVSEARAVLTAQITDASFLAAKWARLVEVAAAGSDRVGAARLTSETKTLIEQITEPNWRVAALVELGKVVSGCNHDEAARLIGEAETLTAQITEPYSRVFVLARLVEVVAGGEHAGAARLVGEAESLTVQITDPNRRADALAQLAEAVVAGGDHDRAARLAGEAEVLVGQITNIDWRTGALVLLTEVATANGDHDRAARLAGEAKVLIGQITDPNRQRDAWARLVEVVVAADDHDRVARLVGEFEALIGQLNDPDTRVSTSTRLAGIIVRASKEDLLVPEHVRSRSPLMIRARRLLAEALVAAPWTYTVFGSIVGELGRVDPPAVRALVDELQVRWKLDDSACHKDGGEG